MDDEKKKTILTAGERQAIKERLDALDEEALFEILRKKAEELGRLPTRADMPEEFYFRRKYGPWPRVLEAAGVKPVSERFKRREEDRARRHKLQRQRRKEKRALAAAAKASRQDDNDPI